MRGHHKRLSLALLPRKIFALNQVQRHVDNGIRPIVAFRSVGGLAFALPGGKTEILEVIEGKIVSGFHVGKEIWGPAIPARPKKPACRPVPVKHVYWELVDVHTR